MPYKTRWVPPELFVIRKGVKVYQTYKDDDVDNGPSTYLFSLSIHCTPLECACEDESECQNVFDVRNLTTWVEPPHPPFLTGADNTPENQDAWRRYQEDNIEEGYIKMAIRQAIDRRLLGFPKGKKEWFP